MLGHRIVMLIGATALMSPAAFAQTPPQQSGATAANCDQLITALQQQPAPNAPVTLDQARAFQHDGNDQACHDALASIQKGTSTQATGNQPSQPAGNQPSQTAGNQPDQTAGNQPAQAAGNQPNQPPGTQVVVQQTAPSVRVEQAAPRVFVQQPQPDVTVNQPQPEITVHQPAPVVTVQIPPPQITVRMPKPQVNVAMAQPQVRVELPKPQVQIVQPAQPQVQVQPAQPQVNVEQAAQQPNVTVQESQQAPQIKYDTAPPQVVVNQPQGAPNVQIEQAGQGAEGGAQPNQATAAAPPATATPTPAPAQPSTQAATQGGTQTVPVSDLLRMEVVNSQGNTLGKVEQVLVSKADNMGYVVVGHGSLGDKQVALPVKEMALQNGKLVVRGLTDDQIRAMPAWKEGDTNFAGVDNNQTVVVSTAA
jgi:hypothetical protein